LAFEGIGGEANFKIHKEIRFVDAVLTRSQSKWRKGELNGDLKNGTLVAGGGINVSAGSALAFINHCVQAAVRKTIR
jgi:hypothetical protein